MASSRRVCGIPSLIVALAAAVLLDACLTAPTACGQRPVPEAEARQKSRDADARQTPPATAEEDGADADEGGGRVARLPPVPDGTPAEILAYVEKISDPAAMPRSKGRKRYYLKKVGAAYSAAADKILAQVKADDRLYVEAVQLKFDGFSMLKSMGDDKSAAARLEFARSLVDSPHPVIARQASRMVLAADVDALYASGSAAGAERLIAALGKLLAATGADAASAKIAAQLLSDLEVLPDGTDAARRAWETFLPLFAASQDPLVRVQAEEGEAVLRRLSLPGKPLRLAGTQFDGTEFDRKPLAGKVVLVDFWATWCRPCVAEIPNLLALREKYGPHGFEVVGISLDDDRDDVEAFLAERKLPWPLLYSGKGTRDPLAVHYGIRSIPQLFVVGRDGNVLSIDARGEKLEALLAEQFPDAR
ncbi:MAG: TlpA family protein disulfide reductase [Planctomycetia bacterium]|jgi:thiol-disulfide isomerase/thioredoxin